jgi:hypothetical protein
VDERIRHPVKVPVPYIDRRRSGVAPGGQAEFIFRRMFEEAFTPPMLADLLPLARSWRPDLLVHENGELASPLVGAILRVPSVTHAFGGAIPASFLVAYVHRHLPQPTQSAAAHIWRIQGRRVLGRRSFDRHDIAIVMTLVAGSARLFHMVPKVMLS